MKVAVITGAAQGIGRRTAEVLAQAGYALALMDMRSCEATLAAAQQSEADAKEFRGDISDEGVVIRAVAAVTKRWGGVDVLVNNAGIMKLSNIAAVDDLTFDSLIAVNLKGTFNGMREAASRLREGGRIVNFSTSVIGLRLETYGIYAATKSAVETLTAIFAKELRGRAITVNAVAPGPTATDLFLVGKPQELIDRMAKMNPLERLGKPEDIAAVVSFLAGPDGAWVNGQVLRANGGMV